MKNWTIQQWVGFAWDIVLVLALVAIFVFTFGSLSNWRWVIDFENALEDIFNIRYFRFYDRDVNWGVWMIVGTGIVLSLSLMLQYDREHYKK